jgi:hypothetical protein
MLVVSYATFSSLVKEGAASLRYTSVVMAVSKDLYVTTMYGAVRVQAGNLPNDKVIVL